MNSDIYELIRNNLYDLEKEYELVEWININHINWKNLSSNSKAISLLEKNVSKIDFENLSFNTSDKAIDLLYKNQDKIRWSILSLNTNPRAIILLSENYDKIL